MSTPSVGQGGVLGGVEPMTREGKSGGTQPRESNIASIKLELAKAGLDLPSRVIGSTPPNTPPCPTLGVLII